jgi:hypothetical protein
MANVINPTSTTNNHKPLVIKNALNCPLVRRVPARKADMPLRNTKVGAQK